MSKMKFFVILFLVKVVISQNKERDIQVQPRCLIGIAEMQPVDPGLQFCPINEIWACRYGDLSCAGNFICGSGPCRWR